MDGAARGCDIEASSVGWRDGGAGGVCLEVDAVGGDELGEEVQDEFVGPERGGRVGCACEDVLDAADLGLDVRWYSRHARKDV